MRIETILRIIYVEISSRLFPQKRKVCKIWWKSGRRGQKGEEEKKEA